MKRVVSFRSDAFDDFCEWANTNRKIFNKLSKLLKETQRTPFEGTGKPEPLKYDKSGYWSRHITKGDRLVYEISEKEIIVISCKGHYE